MGHKKLLETNDDVMLQQKLQLRAPYITPLNILQVSATSALLTPAQLGPSLHALWLQTELMFSVDSQHSCIVDMIFHTTQLYDTTIPQVRSNASMLAFACRCTA